MSKIIYAEKGTITINGETFDLKTFKKPDFYQMYLGEFPPHDPHFELLVGYWITYYGMLDASMARDYLKQVRPSDYLTNEEWKLARDEAKHRRLRGQR